MKKKLLPHLLSGIVLIIPFFFISLNCFAQTADNSIKISGGEYGKGVTFVFAHISKLMDQAEYTAARANGQTTVHLVSNKLIYNGKELQLQVLIDLDDGTGPGTYVIGSKESPPPPNAIVSVQVGEDEGVTGHSIVSESGSVIVTAMGGPGNYVIGSFSGGFFEIINDKKTAYQVSGHFKGYRSPYDGM